MGVLDYSTTPASNTAINGIGIQGTNAISNIDNAMRQALADSAAAISRHVTKAVGSYTPVKADHNQFWRATGAVTLNLTAAATLTDGWALWVKGDGGAITVDPSGAETINGAATLTVADGQSAFIVCTGTTFYAIAFGDVTLSGSQVLTNKTLTTPTLTLKQSATPTPTAEGDIQWDTDDHVIAVGDSSATQLFVPIPASTAAGDLLYLSGAKVYTRLAKGTASQLLRMNAGATAPEWFTQTIDYGAGNAALSYGGVGTYVFGYVNNNDVIADTTYAGSAIEPAGIGLSGAGTLTDDTSTAPTAILKGGSALSGTWRAMGQANQNNGSARTRITLFLRTV